MSKIYIFFIFFFFLIVYTSFVLAAFPDANNIIYYTLNDSDYSAPTVIDFRVNYNSTNNGATNGSSLILGEAFNFDGGNDYLVTDAGVSELNAATHATINMWINPDTIASDDYTFSINDGAADYWREEIFNSDLYVYMYSTDNCYVKYNPPVANRNTMITTVFNGSDVGFARLVVYYNGSKQTQTATAGNPCAGALDNENNLLYIGRRFAGNYFDGDIDEIGVWDRALSGSEILDLFNSGNGIAPSSGDSTPPTLTLNYPTNATGYNNYNGSIIVTANEVIDNCTINDSNWDNDGINNLTQFFNRTTTPDGNYSLTVWCDDTSNNRGDVSFWFVVDTVDPVLNLSSPLNESYQNGLLNVQLTYYDTYLWRTNTSIINSTNGVVYNNYSGNMGAELWYNISETFDTTTVADGNYTGFFEATDSHTTREFKEELNEVVDDKNLLYDETTYILNYGEISFTYPKTIELITTKEIDRFIQEFKPSLTSDTTSYITISANTIIYIKDSVYPCHFIINDKYWFDCVGLDDPRVTPLSDNEFRINYNLKEDGLSSVTRSLGGVNYKNWTTWFMIDNTNPSFVGFTNSTSTSALQLNFNTSENVTLNWTFGLTCAGGIASGTETLNDTFSLQRLVLNSATTYNWNLTIIDVTGNSFNQCVALVTDTAGGTFNINETLCDKNYTTNSTGYFLQETYCIGGEYRMNSIYIAIVLGLIGVISILLYISEKFEFLYFTTESGKNVPMFKYLVYVVCFFLLIPLINVGIVADTNHGLGLTQSLSVFYKAVYWTAWVLISFWVLGVFFFLYKWIAGLGEVVR